MGIRRSSKPTFFFSGLSSLATKAGVTGWRAMVASQKGETPERGDPGRTTGCVGFIGSLSSLPQEDKNKWGYVQGETYLAGFSGIRGAFTNAKATMKPIAARITT
jgi:hypothetical protein